MLEKLSESKSVWDILKGTRKPVVMYGMGDGALKIMRVFEYYGIKLSAIFASDEFVRGHSFEGFKVLTLKQVEEEFDDFIIVIAFGTSIDTMLKKLYGLDEKYEVYAPDVPVCADDDTLFTIEYLKQNEAYFDKVYSLLCDEMSRRTFIDTVNFKISGKLKYLKRSTSPIDEVYENILTLTDNEDFVDLGAYNGDTVKEFLSFTGGKFSSITAFEPDGKNFKKLKKTVDSLNLSENVRLFNIGSHSDKDTLFFANKAGRNSALSTKGKIAILVDSVDNILSSRRASVIKLDVEGAEEQSLKGCEKTIKQYKPKIMLSAYHKNSDLYLLPLMLYDYNADYRFYFRHHPYIPAWETNFYCV